MIESSLDQTEVHLSFSKTYWKQQLQNAKHLIHQPSSKVCSMKNLQNKI